MRRDIEFRTTLTWEILRHILELRVSGSKSVCSSQAVLKANYDQPQIVLGQ